LQLIEADSEYRNYLQSHAAEMHIMRSRRQSANEKVRRSPAESQKLEAILRYLVEKNGHIPSAYMDEQSHQEMRNDRLRQLQIACDFRQEKKQFYLRAALMEQITSTHQVHVRPGQAYFFEFRLTNPFTIDQTVEISFDSLDLRLVTDVNEWKYLQRAYGIQHATVEKDMVAINQNSTLKEVWLRANESLAIPFVFQSPISDYYGESVLDTNTVHVSFVNADTKRPLAFLNLEVHPHSGMEIDQTLRFFGCEGELLKAQMRYTPRFRNQMDSEYNPAYDLTEPGRRFIRCSDDGVICRVDELRLATENSNAYSINIKYRCRESSAIPQKFYIFFYYDPFFTNLGDVWQVFVHSLHRMDVSCWYGQTNQASLILRGSDNGSRGRTLKFFSSSCAEEIKFCKPKIELVGNALNEVEMNIRSKKVGVNDILVNVVGK
jgi:nephrocystin-4